MVLSLLKRILNPDSADGSGKAGDSASPADVKPTPENFVEYVVKALVDTPAEVAVRSVEKERTTTIQVTCEQRDVGKIIGKNGKTIAAIRSLVNGAAGRGSKRISVEVLD